MTKQEINYTILIVDDTPVNIDILNNILHDTYNVKVANNGERALKIANSDSPPDLILLDVMMPDMDGFEVCKILKENIDTKKIPIIFVTAKGEVTDESKGFELGAVDYITKPVSMPIVLARVKTHLALYDQKRFLEGQVRERTEQLHKTQLEIIRKLGRAAEYKDNETGLHVIRMSKYAQQIALAYGLSEDESELLLNAAPMHDIGKIGIPDNVLQKPGKLDKEEWEIMTQHPRMGSEIIGEQTSELLKAAKIAAATHHEKWNGKGYPNNIKGEDIPIYGRIISIADVFDALTSVRPYKKAWPVEEAVDLIKRESGEQFDPAVVDAFFKAFDKIMEIKEKHADKPISE